MSVAGTPEIIVAESPDALVADAAQRAVAVLGAALEHRPVAHLVITGGGILEQLLAALARPDALDWSRVHVWWGDERYVAADSADRNELPARTKFLDHVPVPPAQIHPMPPDDGTYPDVEAAAAGYATELGDSAGADGIVPRFDLVLLGVGPDGHCASLFPNHPDTQEIALAVVGVRESPKPPPLRTSLTFPTLDAADEVWFVASGSGKAHAVALANSGAPREQVPSAGPRGRAHTLWLIDRDAAAEVSF